MQMALMLKGSLAHTWTQKVCLDLARLYEKYELLWNPMHPEYYSAVQKDDAWTEIAHLMSTEVDECKKKVESMKGSYRREKSRARKYARDGLPYTSKWFGYKAFCFLDAKAASRKTNSTTSSVQCKSSPPKELDATQELIWDLGGPPEPTGSDPSPQFAPAKELKGRGARVTRGNGVKRSMDEEPRELYLKEFGEQQSEAGQSTPPKDECAAFAAYVEAKLRKFDEHHQNIAQHRINNMLFEIEMSLYATDNSMTQMHANDAIASAMDG